MLNILILKKMNKNNPKPLYPTSENFKDLRDSYKALITKFLVYNNIEKVVCKDKKNHFFYPFFHPGNRGLFGGLS